MGLGASAPESPAQILPVVDVRPASSSSSRPARPQPCSPEQLLSTVPVKGILKKPQDSVAAAWKRTDRTGQRWWQKWPQCARRGPPKHAGPRLAFAAHIEVTDYSRRLGGGGGLPHDGSTVSLGLGRPKRRRIERLVVRRPQSDAEACIWMPGPERAKVLRKAMGEARYWKTWLRHKREARQIQRSRRLSATEQKEFQWMPRTAKQAQWRARRLAQECSAPLTTLPWALTADAAHSSSIAAAVPVAAAPAATTVASEAPPGGKALGAGTLYNVKRTSVPAQGKKLGLVKKLKGTRITSKQPLARRAAALSTQAEPWVSAMSDSAAAAGA